MEIHNDELMHNFIQTYWPEYYEIQEELEHPTSEIVINCYKHIRKLNIEFLMQITGEQQTSEQSDDISLFELLRFINKLLKTVQNSPPCVLTLIDLYAPTAKRTQVRIKLLLNYLIFMLHQTSKLRDVVTARKAQAHKISLAKDKKENCRMDIAKQAEKIALDEDNITKLKKKLAQVNANYQSLQEDKDGTKRKHKKLQQELKTVLDTCQNKQMLVKNINKNVEKLNEKIVTRDSYNSLNDLKDNLVSKCSELESDSNSIAESLSVKKPDIDRFNMIHKRVRILDNCASQLESIHDNITIVQAEEKAIRNKNNEHVKNTQKMRESVTKIKTGRQEKNAATHSSLIKNNILSQQIQDEIKQLQEDINNEKNHQQQLDKSKNNLEHQIAVRQKMLDEMKDKMQCNNDLYTGMYRRILDAENTLTKNFEGVLENIKGCLAKQYK